MPKNLSFNAPNFFSHLIFHPEDAVKQDRPKAWVATVVLGLFTAGLIHAGVGIYQMGCHLYNDYCVQKKDNQDLKRDDTNAQKIGQEVLGTEKIDRKETKSLSSPSLTQATVTPLNGTKSLEKGILTPGEEAPEVEGEIPQEPASATATIPPLPKTTETPLEPTSSLKIDSKETLEPPFSEAIDTENPVISWKRKIPFQRPLQEQKPSEEKGDLTPPKLWVLETNGQLDTKNPQAEKQFLSALQFLTQNPEWVKDKAHSSKVAAYLVQLAKTDISQSKQLNPILLAYQSILTQHREQFFKILNVNDKNLIATLKMDEKERYIPKNLLSSQSVFYKRALESKFKENNPVIDFSKEESDLKEQFENLATYFLEGVITIDVENVETLLGYAHSNEIPHLQEGCLKFLGACVNINEDILKYASSRGLTSPLVDEMSKYLDVDNFADIMHLAFEHKVSNAIWRGLIFAYENPENEDLKKLTASLLFSPPEDAVAEQIAKLIQAGQECANKPYELIPSISRRNQRRISFGFFNEIISVDFRHVFELIKNIESIASIEELDTRGDHHLISYMDSLPPFLVSFLPHIKEIKMPLFIHIVDITDLTKFKKDNFIKDLKDIQGIGNYFSFIYLTPEETNQYLNLFKSDKMVSQDNNPIILRSLELKTELPFTLEEIEKLPERIPGIHNLLIDRVSLSIPDFPELEFLALYETKNETLDLPSIEGLEIYHCNSLKQITAPEAKEVLFSNCKTLEILNMQNVEVIRIRGSLPKLTTLYLPNAKKLYCKDDWTRNAGTSWKPTQITVPEDCEIFDLPKGCEIIRIPRPFVIK